MEKSEIYITTILGICAVLGVVILSEVCDISRLKMKEACVLREYRPSVSLSGNFEGTQMQISKRGSSYLGCALYTAVDIATFHDIGPFRTLPEITTARQAPLVAIGAIARKFSFINHSVLNMNGPYERRLCNTTTEILSPDQSNVE